MEVTNVMKSPKFLIAGAALLAFAAGIIFEGYTKIGSANAATTTPTTEAPGASLIANPAPAAVIHSSRPASVSSTTRAVYRAPVATTRPKRSWEKEALIIGGSAGAGAAIGAAAGGGKGAGIGALSGAAAGTIYDLATRNK